MDEVYVYNSSGLIEYFRQRGITHDNIKINKKFSNLAPLLKSKEDEKTIFYPYTGEFGTAVIRYMTWFHFSSDKYKIACVPKGYECFFPDAKEFIYDFPSPTPEWDKYRAQRWLFLHDHDKAILLENSSNTFRHKIDGKVYIGCPKKYFLWEKNCNRNIIEKFETDIKSKHPTASTCVIPLGKSSPWHHTRGIKDPLTNKHIKSFTKIPFKNSNKYGIKVDVVFSNRNILSDNRSFKEWPTVIRHLESNGLSVGGIGTKSTSINGMKIINNFDFENPNEAAIEMLFNAKYYIGTDTGVTHLAMNFTHIKALLFRMPDGTGDWISDYKNSNTRIIEEMCKDVNTFNDVKLLCKNIDEFFI